MAERMPNTQLELFDGVGHNMKVEIPDTLANRTRQFVRDVEGVPFV